MRHPRELHRVSFRWQESCAITITYRRALGSCSRQGAQAFRTSQFRAEPVPKQHNAILSQELKRFSTCNNYSGSNTKSLEFMYEGSRPTSYMSMMFQLLVYRGSVFATMER